MRVLALDTAGPSASVAVANSGHVVRKIVCPTRHGHAELVLPAIRDCVRLASLDITEIDLLSVALGPGSFTGLRVGVAAVAGLALGLQKPILGISSLLIGAHAAAEAGCSNSILVVLSSRREELFVQHFSADMRPLTDPESLSPARILERCGADASITLTGDGVDDLLSREPGLSGHPRMVKGQAAVTVLARLATEWSVQASSDPPLPLYVRPADALPRARAGRPVIP